MKKIFFLLLLAIVPFCMNAQVTGSVSVPGTYTDLAAAIADLNAVGISGNVIVNVTAPQITPIGGYILGSAVLNASVNSSNTLTINGGNNTLTAYAGTRTGSLSTANNDAIMILAGTDFVTIQNFIFNDLPTNTTTTLAMENAIAMYNFGTAAGSADGCQNITISGCTINFSNSATLGAAVYASNYNYGAQASVTWNAFGTSPGDMHRDITITTNNFANIYNGIVLRGSTAANARMININNNTFTDYGGAGTAAYGVYVFYTDSIFINSNIFTTGATQTTTSYAAFLSTSCGGYQELNGNTITLRGATVTGATLGLSATSVGTGRRMNNNILQFGSFTAATSAAITGLIGTYSGGNANVTFEMNNNSCINQSYTPPTLTTSTIILFSNAANTGGNRKTITSGNTVTNFTRIGSGALYPISLGTADSAICTNNNINTVTWTNNSASGVATFTGIYNNGSPLADVISNNTVSGVAVTGTSTSTAGILRGIFTNTTASGQSVVHDNTISNLSFGVGTHTGAVLGIFVGIAPHIIYNNNIYNLAANQALGNVSGIALASGTPNIAYNNMISDLRAPASTSATAISGIGITGGTNALIYNNTIFPSSAGAYVGGTNFGAAGIYQTSTINSDIKNNIINITGTPTGTAYIASIKRSAIGTAGVNPTNLTLDYNIHHAPYIYGEGTTLSTATNVYYISGGISGTADPNFNSHCGLFKKFKGATNAASENNLTSLSLGVFAPTGSTYADNTAISLPSVTQDFASTTRSVTPDRGALEFSATSLDAIVPSIVYTPINISSFCTQLPTITATITDVSGISSTNAPRIYYKRVTTADALVGNTSADNGWKFVVGTNVGSTYTFQMDPSILFGAPLASGDVIQYFITAEDNALPANVSVVMADLSACPNSAVLIPSNFPTTALPAINTLTITSAPNATLVAKATPNSVCVNTNSTLTLADTIYYSTPTTTGYCIPNAVSNVAYYIGNFTTTGGTTNINNTTGDEATTYADYYATNEVAAVAGSTIGFTGTADGSTNTYGWTMYIDWNRDGIFNTTNERVFSSTGYTATTSGSFTIPANAVGKYRLRFLNNYNVSTNIEPCNTSSNPTSGETEDYSLNVADVNTFPNSAIVWTSNTSATIATNPNRTVTGTNIPSTTIFTATVTDAGGCTYSASTTVTVGPLTAGTTTATPSTLCVGDTTQLAVTASGGGLPYTYLWTGAGLMSNNIANPKANPTTTTTYTVTVTDACSNSFTQTITVTVNPLPIVSAVPASITVCAGNLVTLTGNGNAVGYSWTGGITDNTAFIPTTTTAYTVTGTSALGCTATATSMVTVNSFNSTNGPPNPELLYYNFNGTGTSVPNLALTPPVGTYTATILGGITQGSAGQSGTALVGSGVSATTDYLNTGWAPSLGTGPWTISFWSSGISTNATLYYVFGDGNSNSFRCFTNGAAGSGVWRLTGGGLANVNVPNAALATPTLTTFVYDNIANDVKAYVNGILAVTVPQTAPNITGAGPFKVMGYNTNIGAPVGGLMDEFRVYNRALLPAEIAQLVTLTAPLSASVSLNTICKGDTSTLSATGANSYVWNPGAIPGDTIKVTPTATTIYTVTGTDANGCTSTSTVTINVTQPLIAATPASQNICAGGTTPASIVATGATTYTWTPTTGLTFNATNDTAMALPSTTTTYSVSGADVNGCIGTAMATVVVEALPVKDSVTATPLAVCTNGTSMLNAHFEYPKAAAAYCSSNATNSADTKIDTVKFAGVITGSSPTNPETYTNNTSVVIPATAGLPLPLQIINGSASLNHYSARVKVWIDYNQDNVFNADEMVYEFGQTSALNAIPATTVTIPTTALNGLTRMRVVFRESGTTTSTVACGTYTYGETEDYTVNISGATSPITYSYAWTPSASVVSPTSAATATNAISNTSTFTVTATSSGAGCSATDSVTVSVTPLSAAQSTASKYTLCVGDSSQLGVTSAGGGLPYTYSWSPTTGMALGAGTTSNPWVTPASTTTYTVTVTDACNTTATSTVMITVNPLPTLTVSANDSTLCFGDSSILTAVGTGATFATTVTLAPSKDNTIYEETPTNSNGAGPSFVAGRNGFAPGFIGRALLAFDLSSIPPGAVITTASLQLNCSQNPNTTPQPFMLHKTLSNWGEGSSVATQPGLGTSATINDATWLNAFNPSPAWGTPGGVFTPTASATQTVIGQGLYTWSGAGMVADIQSWVSAPSTNNGWLLKGQETASSQARRFDSRENPTVANRPSLTVTYTLPSTSYTWMPGALNGGGVQNVAPTSSTTYSVTYLDSATGCKATASLPITSIPQQYTVASSSASAICVGDSVNIMATDSVPALPYCNSSFSNVTYEFITNVNYGGINNTSGANTGGPVNYTAQQATVTAGVASPLSVTIDPDANDYIYAWIDWNMNGSFTDVGETYIIANAVSTAGPHTLSITPPLSAINGNTRMRVMVDWNNSSPNPCRVSTYGEAEDYTINVSGGTPNPASPVYTYTWMPGSLNGATQKVSPSAMTTYIATQTDVNGCTAQDSVTISVNAKPNLAVSASPNDTVCAGSTVTLLSNATGATSYFWNGIATTGPDSILAPAVAGMYTVIATNAAGCSATDSVNVTISNPVITSLTATPSAVCLNGSSVLSVSPGIAGGPTPYCNSAFTSVQYEFVTNVNYGGINNTSVGSVGGPVNYTSQVANVTAGLASTLSVTIDPDASDYIYAWIDWNQNGILNDAGEVYTLATLTSSSGPHTLSITPPLTALNGPTRMRVMVDYNNSAPDPCRSATWGEAEDYTVNVSGGTVPTPGFASITWSPATNLNSTSLATVTASNVTALTTYTVQGTDAFGCTTTSSVTVTVTPTPTGNTFSNPIVVNSLPFIGAGDNMSANCWTDAFTGTGNRPSPDVFYRFTLPNCNDSVVASLCGGSTWDTYMHLLDNTGTQVSFNDDGCLAQSVINFGGLTKGAIYYIVVEGYSATHMGTFTLDLKTFDGAVANALAPATSNQTINQPDASSVNYYDGNCNLITTINDGVGGNILGSTMSVVTVDPTASFHNGQPYARRWYQITPTSNGAADVKLYFTQADFDNLNLATMAPYVQVPTSGSNTDPNIANIRITKNDDAGLGTNPIVLTPTTVNWNGTYWEVTVSTPSFSQFRLHGVNPGNAALSVSYKTFTVSKEATSDLVEWTTVNERNNSHFNVQRSADGQSFETLGTLQTKATNGTSAAELSYSYVDANPMMGHNYYRLEQVDVDSKTSYTKTIDIVWGVQGSVVSIYPNPTKDILNIDLSTDKVSQTEIKLLDMSGRVVKSVIAQTIKGQNTIKLDMNEIASGVYGIQVFENNKLTHVSKVRKND